MRRLRAPARLELARECLAHDFDVLVCAEDTGIQGVATQRAGQGVVISFRADLATQDGVERLYTVITGSVVSTAPNPYQAVYGQADKDDPALVARNGFAAMMAGKDSVLGGSFKRKVEGVMNEILPETFKAAQAGKTTKPGSAKH